MSMPIRQVVHRKHEYFNAVQTGSIDWYDRTRPYVTRKRFDWGRLRRDRLAVEFTEPGSTRCLTVYAPCADDHGQLPRQVLNHSAGVWRYPEYFNRAIVYDGFRLIPAAATDWIVWTNSDRLVEVLPDASYRRRYAETLPEPKCTPIQRHVREGEECVHLLIEGVQTGQVLRVNVFRTGIGVDLSDPASTPIEQLAYFSRETREWSGPAVGPELSEEQRCRL